MTKPALKLRVGTRESALAMVQTELVIDKLKSLHPSYEWEVVPMKTKGDEILNKTLLKIGEKSLFTRELETALIEGAVDFVVHALKDLPTTLPDGLSIGAILEREEPEDAVVFPSTSTAKTLSDLNEGAVIGTSSLRRIAQLRRKFPDFEFKSVRGNLNTRLRKLDKDKIYDALILAVAGLKRLGWGDRISEKLLPSQCLYAVGQGAIAVECRKDDNVVGEVLRNLNHADTALRCLAERSFMKALEGGCSVPLGVYSTMEDNFLRLKGGVFAFDGKQSIVETREVSFKDSSEKGQGECLVGIHCSKLRDSEVKQAVQLGEDLAEAMLKEGARELLNKARQDAKDSSL